MATPDAIHHGMVSVAPSQAGHVNQPTIPTCDTIIDLTVLKGDKLKSVVLELIATLFPDWAKGVTEYQLDRVSGALTNAVFFVSAPNRDRLLLRVYGIGCDQIVDRENELAWLARLSQLNVGPRLLATFGNGRFEEYMPSVTLTRDDIRDPDTSVLIAKGMRRLHAISKVYPPTSTDRLEIWVNVDKFYRVVLSILPELYRKNEGWAKVLREYNIERLQHEIAQCKAITEAANSPIVFAHNDTQPGNILRCHDGELVIVDFEYAGYNPRGFDIANHFCEWMYDYHSDTPASMETENYPTEEQQMRFLSAYVAEAKAEHSDAPSVEALSKEVAVWVMAGHVLWGLWGLIQANQSEIDFDYFLYSIQRLNAFRNEFSKYA
ncbi:kinase-like domain-containing protein [Radiomyces spectabilis]|uniref:kinase-like domain-containing protein n=1 Tax=Radiomyces spectabilis TaxID=64574 RepID=UPI00221E6026|nr:kinase-like domain-containing protein [Radiomyces spectabilis]KAI8391830.1 kinase-like domain-containing protein [Radiomyces spectabilis]